MKKTILLFGWLLVASSATFSQTTYLENILLENLQVIKEGNNVTISTDIFLDDIKLDRQQMIKLIPVLVSSDESMQKELNPIWLEGKVRSKVNARKRTLNTLSENNDIIIKRNNNTEQKIKYNAIIPFNKWMINSRLELRGYITGCAGCNEGNEILNAGTVLSYQEADFMIAPAMTPIEEEIKQRVDNRIARLEYIRNKYAVQPDYNTNRTELDNIQQSLDLVKNNPNITITGIYIIGYASPEGSVVYNTTLSQRRAQTLAQYIQGHNKTLNSQLWHVSWEGEDWNGFQKQVEHATNWEKQQSVLQALANCKESQDACEEQIRTSLSAQNARYLLNELYVPLRRSEYRIEYTVRNFSTEESKEIIKRNPELLSAAEIQRVADSYGKNSESYHKTLDIGLRTYPDNTALRYNAALAAVETEKYTDAIDLLKDSEDGTSLNLLGVSYYKKGNKRAAEKTFRKAAALGYSGAEQNAENVRLSIEMLGE